MSNVASGCNVASLNAIAGRGESKSACTGSSGASTPSDRCTARCCQCDHAANATTASASHSSQCLFIAPTRMIRTRGFLCAEINAFDEGWVPSEPSVEIRGQRGALLCVQSLFGAIGGMFDACHHFRAVPEIHDRARIEFEAQEMHGSGFLLVAARQVLVRDRGDG